MVITLGQITGVIQPETVRTRLLGLKRRHANGLSGFAARWEASANPLARSWNIQRTRLCLNVFLSSSGGGLFGRLVTRKESGAFLFAGG